MVNQQFRFSIYVETSSFPIFYTNRGEWSFDRSLAKRYSLLGINAALYQLKREFAFRNVRKLTGCKSKSELKVWDFHPPEQPTHPFVQLSLF